MTKEDAIRRIELLRAKTTANGCTENEANMAMQCLNSLLNEFNLSLTETDVLNSEFIGVELEASIRQPIHTLVNDIGYYTDCQSWYEVSRVEATINYKFLGTKEDALNAQYLFVMLNSSIGFETRTFMKGKKTKTADEGFIRGMCSRLGERLREMKRESVGNEETGYEYGLVVRSKKQKIQEILDEENIRLHTVSDRARYSKSSFAEGYEKGNNISLNKGIGENPIGRKQLR